MHNANATLPPVPIKDTMLAAFRIIKSEWRVLLKFLLLPSAVIGLVGCLIPANTAGAQDSEVAMYNVLFFTFNFFLQPWLAVAAFRFLILGVNPGKIWPHYQPRMWRYLWKSLVMGFALVAPVVILGGLSFAFFSKLIAVILTLLLILLASVASGRVLLALPASAVADDNRLKTAWRLTRGQALRILTIKFLGQLAIIIPYIIVALLAALLSQIIPIAGKFISVAALSFSQLVITYPIDAVLYGYFYGDMLGNQAEKNESHVS